MGVNENKFGIFNYSDLIYSKNKSKTDNQNESSGHQKSFTEICKKIPFIVA